MRKRGWGRIAAVGLTIGAGWMLLVVMAHAYLHRTPHAEHTIHIAFGFHVNLYHSFRNDTDDESGFGQDIRIIRYIIRVLDRLNAEGIPVKGVWDFDNLFSLQELLPRHAPDIITDIQRRVRHQGDEVILMSYNNGMVSAMTAEELRTSMTWAVSNPWGSGVADLFGTYTPIVRPQEMMHTAGAFDLYREMGIQAAALYYSATPFDAFRVFTRPLSTAEAHNPISYRNPHTGEQMTIVPTYHFGDLLDQVSLRQWVQRLRRMQVRGELRHDALIFINYDADSELWSGIDLPRPLRWLPNTRGIEGLVKEVSDLGYVRFTTIGEYLAERPPVGTIYFGQDTADGSFNGYSSWSEKADATRYWTIIQRNRRVCAAAQRALPLLADGTAGEAVSGAIDLSRTLRMRALSTTHFGMATPFLAPQRQAVADALMADLDHQSDLILNHLAMLLRPKAYRPSISDDNGELRIRHDSLMVIGTDPSDSDEGHRFIAIPTFPTLDTDAALYLVGKDGAPRAIWPMGRVPDDVGRKKQLVYIPGPRLADGVYHLEEASRRPRHDHPPKGNARASTTLLMNEHLAVHVDARGRLEGIFLDGRRQVDSDSLLPRLIYAGRRIEATEPAVKAYTSADGRWAMLHLSGPLPAPGDNALHDGWIDYRLTLTADLPYLFLEARLIHPATAETDRIKPGVPGLERPADLRWEETAPAEIHFAPRATPAQPPTVIKYNYLGVAGEYRLDYFRHDERNLNLDNVNNHITSAYVAVTAGGRGMAVAMDTGLQANFAFAPLRMRHEPETDTFALSINPFGNYTGRQYRPPTTGNGHGFEATLRAGEQFTASAPTHNGTVQHFGLMLAFFEGPPVSAELHKDLLAFACRPLVFSLGGASENRASQRETPTGSAPGQEAHSLKESFKPEEPWLTENRQVPAHQPEMPIALSLRVVWANVRTLMMPP